MESDTPNPVVNIKLDSATDSTIATQATPIKQVFLKLSQIPKKEILHKLILSTSECENQNKKHHRKHHSASSSNVCKYQLGDMLWAKIRGYPFWPCMISKDPFTNTYVKSLGHSKRSKTYHVQFFGHGYNRSWVNEASVIKFEGREKYFEIIKYGPDEPWRYCKPSKAYTISPVWFPSWSHALADAERAFKLPVERRRELYTFHYMYKMGGKEYSVHKMVERVRRRLLGLPNDHHDVNEGKGQEGKSQPAKKKTKVRKGNFNVFYQRQAKMVEKEYPDWTILTVVNYLQEKWLKLSERERSIYFSRTSCTGAIQSTEIGKIKRQKTQERALPRQLKITPESLDLQIVKLKNVMSGLDTNLQCKVCCKKRKNVQLCQGVCQQYICLKCGFLKDVGKLYCGECSKVYQVCFVCKTQGKTTTKCSKHSCDVYYHESCVTQFQQTKVLASGFICPLHACSTCSDSQEDRPLLPCVQCPITYHSSELCIAAGCLVKTKESMVCSKHFKSVQSQQAKVNVKKCLDCDKGGKLHSCHHCPAAYCSDCANKSLSECQISILFGQTTKSKPVLLCTDCKMGKSILYGDIVWVKVKFFKWWPAEVCHPLHIPDKFQLKISQPGRFPVRCFGSSDYCWTHQGRVLLYGKVKAKLDRGYNSGDLFAVYSRGVQEAEVANQFCLTFKQSFSEPRDLPVKGDEKSEVSSTSSEMDYCRKLRSYR